MALKFVSPICLGSAIESYNLQWRQHGEPDSAWQEQDIDADQTTATITGVSAPLKYEITIAAVSSAGPGGKGCCIESPPPSEPSAGVLYCIEASYDRVSCDASKPLS